MEGCLWDWIARDDESMAVDCARGALISNLRNPVPVGAA
ncbi:hypothetical protein AB691_3882 [Stutzerimonas stutzeri]|nr:hypothetical protein AB691_3882 [Stutzerimonas stutzeri]